MNLNVTRALVATLALGLPIWQGQAPVAQAAYVFTKIADTTFAAPAGNFSDFGYPSVSGSRVGFLGYYNGLAGTAILTGSGGPLTTIAKPGDPAPAGSFNYFGEAAIGGNAAAFFGLYAGSIGLFAGSGGGLTTIVKAGDTAPVGTFLLFQNPAYDGGTAAFLASYGGQTGILTSNGGTPTTIVQSGDAAPVGTFSDFGNIPDIDGGTVAFMGVYNGTAGRGVFAGSGGALTTIAKTGDTAPAGSFTHFDWPAVSGGSVAFRGYYPGGSGIFTGSGGALTTIVKTGDPAPSGVFTDFLFAQNGVSISGDLVVFPASYGSSGEGLFMSRAGGAPVPIILRGDALFGSTLSYADLGTFAADGSRVAFRYILGDGRRGVAMVTVPEPSSAVLLLLGAATAVVAARRRTRRVQRPAGEG